MFVLQCERPGFDPGVEKIPWRRKWLPTPVFLPEESHGQRSLVGYSPQVAKSRTQLSNFTFTFTLMRTARFICVCFNSVFCVVIFDVLCLATMWCRHATILLELDFLSLYLETRALRNTYLDHL